MSSLTCVASSSIDTYSDSAAVTHKDEEDVEMDAVNEGANENDVLIRCTNGADVNFSTRVSRTDPCDLRSRPATSGPRVEGTEIRIRLSPGDGCAPSSNTIDLLPSSPAADTLQIPPTLLPQFHTLYATHLRATFAPSMIKRDKKKEKVKAEKRETWKKQLAVDVRTESRVEGSGKKTGHRQRVSH